MKTQKQKTKIMKTINEYEKKAIDFLKKTNVTIKIEFLKYDFHFQDDKEKRNVYKITLKRENKIHSFTFGQSIFNTKKGIKPTAYDILACLTKYDVGTFNDFINEFGFNLSSMAEYNKINKLYKAVKKEFAMVKNLWSNEEFEELSEID